MTIYERIKAKLEKHPDFRERRFRSDKLATLALRHLELEDLYLSGRQLPLADMVEFAKTYDSYRHEYDAVLKDCPELRGEDYADGKALAQSKCIEFGYVPGHAADKKTLEKIGV